MKHLSMNATDEPVSSYLPEFCPSQDIEIGRKATLIDILSHRTGLEDDESLYSGPNGVPMFTDRKQVLQLMNSMSTQPGRFRKYWTYNPLLYALVGYVIQDVSGMNLEDFFRTRIFGPLAMNSTSFIGSKSIPSDEPHSFAKPYTTTSSKGHIRRTVPESAYQTPFDASMGIQSSTVDMAKWATAMATNFRALGSGPESSMSSMSSQHIFPETEAVFKSWCPLPPNEGGKPAYCLGWLLHHGHYIFDDIFDLGGNDGDLGKLDWPCTLPVLDDKEPSSDILFHSGLGHGFASSLHIYPQRGDAVIVLGNSSNNGGSVDVVAKVLTTIISEQGLDWTTLVQNTKLYADYEMSRWRLIREEIHQEQVQRQEHGCLNIPLKQILGTYLDPSTGVSIHIEPETSSHEKMTHPAFENCTRLAATLRFGNVANVRLHLWWFCTNTACFFPTEIEYQALGMAYMAHWAQYLLHFHLDSSTEHISGLWWQHSPERDGTWYPKTTD